MIKLTDDDAADLSLASFQVSLSDSQAAAQSTISKLLAPASPFVEDIQALYRAYDILYFCGMLAANAELIWSKRLTLCAGICELKNYKDKDAPPIVKVKLSEALLKFRPREDTVNTLLHESIHAYLFIAGGRHTRGDDPSGHGSGFLRIARGINNHGKTFAYNITVYHTFHEEVDSYRTHVWQCNGSCVALPPYFGIVRRAMNRPPGPNDTWYTKHATTCGGTWTKIASPAAPLCKNGKKRKNTEKLDGWLVLSPPGAAPGGAREGGKKTEEKKRKIEVVEIESDDDDNGNGKDKDETCLMRVDADLEGKEKKEKKEVEVECPVCSEKVVIDLINTHLDTVHKL